MHKIYRFLEKFGNKYSQANYLQKNKHLNFEMLVFLIVLYSNKPPVAYDHAILIFQAEPISSFLPSLR